MTLAILQSNKIIMRQNSAHSHMMYVLCSMSKSMYPNKNIENKMTKAHSVEHICDTKSAFT